MCMSMCKSAVASSFGVHHCGGRVHLLVAVVIVARDCLTLGGALAERGARPGAVITVAGSGVAPKSA
jgi:hypothetical protein